MKTHDLHNGTVAPPSFLVVKNAHGPELPDVDYGLEVPQMPFER